MLTTISNPIPHARWGLNIVGSLPIGNWKRKYIFIVVDYFTKWVEAKAVNIINNKVVVNFIIKKIICQFGVLVQIIIDNRTQFSSKEMKKLCKDNEIKLSFTSVYHPKTNKQVEAVNKKIVKILKRKAGEHPESWTNILLDVMWADRAHPIHLSLRSGRSCPNRASLAYNTCARIQRAMQLWSYDRSKGPHGASLRGSNPVKEKNQKGNGTVKQCQGNS